MAGLIATLDATLEIDAMASAWWNDAKCSPYFRGRTRPNHPLTTFWCLERCYVQFNTSG